VKHASLTNDGLKKVMNQQKTVVGDQSLRIRQLEQQLTSERSMLGQLRAELACHDTDNDQLIASLRLELKAVSR